MVFIVVLMVLLALPRRCSASDPQNAGFVSGQLMDLANKLQEAGGKMGGSRSGPGSYTMPEKKKEETPLAKCCRDG